MDGLEVDFSGGRGCLWRCCGERAGSVETEVTARGLKTKHREPRCINGRNRLPRHTTRGRHLRAKKRAASVSLLRVCVSSVYYHHYYTFVFHDHQHDCIFGEREKKKTKLVLNYGQFLWFVKR